MKKTILMATIVAFVSSTTLFGCKKISETLTTLADIEESKIMAEDAAFTNAESDVSENEINNTVASSERFCGQGAFFNNGSKPLDADTSFGANGAKKITFTFNGVSQNCKKRTGIITVELLNKAKWIEAGAVLKYVFINFKVQNICNGKSITVNGERFVTNVSGGNLFTISKTTFTPLIHKIRTGTNGLAVTFTDSTSTKTANWNVARKTTINFAGTAATPIYKFSFAGDTTIGNYANLESWGTNRNGKTYKTVFTNAVDANTACGLHKPTAGLVAHTVNSFNFNVLLGLDISGAAVSTGCAGYYKVSWASGSVVVPYK
jgi:hypothetical protein